jgi:hypothetical protein
VMLTLSTDVLETIWIADSEDMPTLSAASAKDLLAFDGALTSEESMDSKAFSFFEFCEHNKIERFLK